MSYGDDPSYESPFGDPDYPREQSYDRYGSLGPRGVPRLRSSDADEHERFRPQSAHLSSGMAQSPSSYPTYGYIYGYGYRPSQAPRRRYRKR
ncbi:hypothetical protein B1400_0202 [Bifidobacterium italicum]|uniref:Uncharacterized protein n=1 Tax=Bifidobacterium italicum TaxID=1960968 RepID=A0A2A2EM49_9BIFI|nr:hypothetical protein B1400_0202 [Bifidobacterium italicum]